MKATIITIGDEILIGQIVDTNSVSIARHLNAAGIVVHEKVSIGDDSAQIVGCVERALGQSDIAIITGGLGPTKDDITKKTLAEMFGSELILNQTVSDHVKRMLEERGIEFNELNRGQAMVPACCTVLFNAHGTAPGMWFERGGKVVVSLPGVPYEMEHLMQDEVMPRLKAHFELRQIVHRTMITAGLPESMLAKAIEAWENALPPYLKLAYLPNPGAVRLRLSAYEVEGESVSKEIERQFEALRRIIPHNIIGYETATMQELIHKLLTERRQTLATAPSRPRKGDNPAPQPRAARAAPSPRALRPCRALRPTSSAAWFRTATRRSRPYWASIPTRSPVTAPSANRSPARWPKGRAASAAPTTPSPPPASQAPLAARPKSPSARYGSPSQGPAPRSPCSNSAAPTADRSSTAPAPSPSVCCATNSTENKTTPR